MSDDVLGQIAGTRAMYVSWVSEIRAEQPAVGAELPAWGDLTSEQSLDWMALHAAAVEVSWRSAKAMVPLIEEANHQVEGTS